MKTVKDIPRGWSYLNIRPDRGWVRADAPAFTFDEALSEAMNAAHKMCSDHDHKRKWLTADIPDTDGSKDHHAQLWVLEGSPPKAFILQTPAFLRFLNSRGSVQATWCEFEEGWWVLAKKKPDSVARIIA